MGCGCVIGLVAFFMPRLAIVALLLFTDWIESCFRSLQSPLNALGGLLIPILGLIFAPYTLLAYCLTIHQNGGVVSGMWIVLIVIAVLLDLGVIGQGGSSRKHWRKERRS